MSSLTPTLENTSTRPIPDILSSSYNIGRSMFYRYEYGGTLVYDLNSRLSTSPASFPEQLSDNTQPRPKIRGNLDYDRIQYETMKKYPPQRSFIPVYTLVVPETDILKFESRFESGNLHKAIKVSENEYNLLLNNDTETLGYTQWYYFSVKPYKDPHTVRFNIINLMKFESLYNEGMKPAVFSMKKYETQGIGWQRDCTNLGYYQNSFKRSVVFPNCPDKLKFYYTLTFTYKFDLADDEVFFAYSYPYTFSDLQSYLDSLTSNEKFKKFLRVNSFCQTLAGNPCYLLTITSKIESYTFWQTENEKIHKSSAARRYLRLRELREESKNKSNDLSKNEEDLEHKMKKGIFFTARVHPGEPNSSYMAKGVIDFLLSDCKEAKLLRKKTVFKIIPMLNPDGVIYGNYRCSLLGVDLNRRWKHPNPVMHPTIHYAKKLIQVFTEEREVALFCDFHGHSIKKDVFAYACCYKKCDIYRAKENLLIRLLPFLLSQVSSIFSYESSRFRVERSKLTTGRIVNFKENKILTSYTIEASFFGSSLNNTHFTIKELEKFGKDLASVCSVFHSQKAFKTKILELSSFLQKEKIEEHKKIESLKPDPSAPEEENFSIKEALNQFETLQINQLEIPEEDENSGGSDSEASLNDEKKLKFLLKKEKKQKKKNIKHSESPLRPSQMFQNTSFVQVKNSATPDSIIKYRTKSRNTFKRKGEPIKQIIPTKIMLKSPFLEENAEFKSQNSLNQKPQSKLNKETSQIKPLRKLDDILRELGLSESSLFYKSATKKSKLG